MRYDFLSDQPQPRYVVRIGPLNDQFFNPSVGVKANVFYDFVWRTNNWAIFSASLCKNRCKDLFDLMELLL